MGKIFKQYSRSQLRRRIAGLLCCTIMGTQTNILQASAAIGSLLGEQLDEWSEGVRSHRATDSDWDDSVLTGEQDDFEATPSNAGGVPTIMRMRLFLMRQLQTQPKQQTQMHRRLMLMP